MYICKGVRSPAKAMTTNFVTLYTRYIALCAMRRHVERYKWTYFILINYHYASNLSIYQTKSTYSRSKEPKENVTYAMIRLVFVPNHRQRYRETDFLSIGLHEIGSVCLARETRPLFFYHSRVAYHASSDSGNFDALVRRCSAYPDHVRRPERTLNRRKLNGGRQVFFTDDRARPPLGSTNRRGSSKIKLSRISKFEHRLVAETKLPRLARADLKFAAPRYIDMLEVLTLGNFGSVLTRTRLSLSRSAKFTPTSFFSLL